MGELSAMEWLASRGARIYLPLGHSPDVDLIAELNGRLLRVEVKTSTSRRNHGGWEVVIATRGGNQSWSGLVKHFEASRCEYLFVHVGDGRRWFIPTGALDGRTGITLGGPKYSEFEIEAGRPLGPHASLESLIHPGERRSGRAGPDCKFGAKVLRGFESLLPHHPDVRGGTDPSSGVRLSSPTRVSANHQVTIPSTPFGEAGLRVGDRLRVEALDDGVVVLTRIRPRQVA
jgi:Holliday junction resolvase-like predicted endonuclease